MTSAKRTQDHREIQEWITQHGGSPAIVQGTEDDGGGIGLLRIKFTDGEDLQEVEWQQFFDTFDQKDLWLLYDPDPNSRFFKFVAE